MIPTPSFTAVPFPFGGALDDSVFNASIDPQANFIADIKGRTVRSAITSATALTQNTDYIVPITASSSFDITLPAATGQESAIYFKRTDRNFSNIVNLIIDPLTSDTIEDASDQLASPTATSVPIRPGESILYFPTGTTWRIWSRDFNPNIRVVAYAGSTTSLSTVAAKINLNTEQYDTASAFNTTTSTFTCPLKGWYGVSGALRRTGGTAGAFIFANYVYTDTSAASTSSYFGQLSTIASGGDQYYPMVARDIYMDVGDTLYMDAYVSSGTSTAQIGGLNQGSLLTIKWISQ